MLLWVFIFLNIATVSLVVKASIRQGWLSHPYLFHWVVTGVVAVVGLLLRVLDAIL